jgi:hypothetical protein
MVAPVPAEISKLPPRNLPCSSRRSGPTNSRPVNLLQPLASLFPTPVLCFQQLAASFPKIPGVVGYPKRIYGTPGWGVPRFPFQPPTCPLLTHPLSSSSGQTLCFLSHPCNPSSFMRLRTLLPNGAPLSSALPSTCALFPSSRGCTPSKHCPLLAVHYPLSRLEA